MASITGALEVPRTGGDMLRNYLEAWFRMDQVVPNPFGSETPTPPMKRVWTYIDEALTLRAGSPADKFFRGADAGSMELWAADADGFRTEVSRVLVTIRALAHSPDAADVIEKAARPRSNRRTTIVGLPTGSPGLRSRGALVGSPTSAITADVRRATTAQLAADLDSIVRGKVNWLRTAAGKNLQGRLITKTLRASRQP